MVIGFKENSKLNSWQTLTLLLLVYFWAIFKFLLFISTKHDNLDYPSWWIITLFCTTCLDLYLGWGLVCIEKENENENTDLNDVRVETDEERRPLFEPKENYGDNITNNDKHVHGQACQCRRFSCQSNFAL